MSKELAPITLFIYNRPHHTAETLKALAENELANESILYVFADGPKKYANSDDKRKIEQTRAVAKSVKWCRQVNIIERESNMGLADSIVSGVTQIVNKHGKIIVLEDDIVPAAGFLKYMNDALDIYEKEEHVMQISGYIYPLDISPSKASYFLKILSCWGWGTWARAWKSYVHDIDHHLLYWKTQALKKKFDIEGNAFFYEQLLNNKRKNIYTWAVRWYSSWLKQDGFSLFPAQSLVKNIGMDNTGENSIMTNIFSTTTVKYIPVKAEKIIEETEVRLSVDRFFQAKIFRKPKLSFFIRTKEFFKNLVRPVYNIFKKPVSDLIKNEQRSKDEIIYNTRIGSYTKIYPPFSIIDAEIDNYTYISKNSLISLSTVGKFCSIGPGFFCGYGIHPVNGISTSPMFYSTLKQNGISLAGDDKVIERKKITIGNDVFIGANVTVLDGIVIGDGAVIAAGAVVTRDVPPYAIAGGVPAKIIRYRFSQEIINELLRIKWWEWDTEKLKKVEEYFFDIEQFIKIVRQSE